MSSPARSLRDPSKSQTAKPEILSREDAQQFLDQFNELVSNRAYELFDQDGRLDGNDVSHWLQAEHELTAPLPEVRESVDSFSATLRLAGVALGGVKVYATEDRAIVYAEGSAPGDADALEEGRRSNYWLIRWPEIVDPATCRAELDEDILTITARKAEIESRTGTESSEGL